MQCCKIMVQSRLQSDMQHIYFDQSFRLFLFCILHSGALAVSSDIFYETSSTSGSASSTLSLPVSSPCVMCNGSEPRLINCTVAPQCSCQTTGYAGVICQGQYSEPLDTALELVLM